MYIIITKLYMQVITIVIMLIFYNVYQHVETNKN